MERKKDELTHAYKSCADYAFPNDETCHICYENAADSVLCIPTNDECQFPNCKYVMQKCTAYTSIDLLGVERDSSTRAPMIMFNTYMTQFTCSYHGILIREKITTYLDAKGTSKNCFLYEQLIQARNPNFTRGRLYGRLKLFSIQRNIGDFYKYFYIEQIEKLSYHCSCYKLLRDIMR